MIGNSKGIAKPIVLLAIAAFMFFSPARSLAAADDSNNRFPGIDAVFVLDTSYSMKDSDPNRIATEVINMFMDISETSSTRVGFTAYNHMLVEKVPLTPVALKDKREALKRKLSELRRSGYTDIGLGLREGTNLLERDKIEGNKRFVILLSDGETDFGNQAKGRTLQDSNEDIQTAIDNAKSGQYPIYTIGLNHDGTVNKNELNRIAAQTGGQSYMTDSADDLPEIFNKIFAEQFQSQLVPVAALTATGSLQEVTVTIPNSSMREANIVLLAEHPLRETQLYYQSANIRYSKSDSYSLLKILKPQKGTFKLKFRGASGDLIKVSLLGNYDMHLQAKITNDSIVKGKPVTFVSSLVHPNEQMLQDLDVYQSLDALLIIYDYESQQRESIPMKLHDDHFQIDYVFKKSGQYSWSVHLNGPDFYRILQENIVDITNLAPTAIDKTPLSLTKEDGQVTIPLSDYFSDPNADPLKYTIVSDIRANQLDAQIIDDSLLLTPKKSGKIELTIEATDPEGSTVTNMVALSVKSLWERNIRVALIILGVLIVAALLYWYYRPKPLFTGRLEGYFLDTASGNDIPVKYWSLTSFAERKLTLKKLFESLDIHEQLPETAHIVFEAAANGALVVSHNTRCTLTIGSVPVGSNRKASLHYNDKLYITFEDGITEIELRYKAIKPSTNIFNGRAS
ncbi:VWA domain-containing protein [Cohnella terricola]|uniref:VWA domain-containing protein n=1 Tax=Cohnella terricola TaxID=1289167 RepID=A0A559J5B5_9BACL|nr:VWA domain-containing protein [Cohnella terricola]TVX95083.1 VWA domain-containing protein [Cohnella terricola]